MSTLRNNDGLAISLKVFNKPSIYPCLIDILRFCASRFVQVECTIYWNKIKHVICAPFIWQFYKVMFEEYLLTCQDYLDKNILQCIRIAWTLVAVLSHYLYMYKNFIYFMHPANSKRPILSVFILLYILLWCIFSKLTYISFHTM